MTSDSSLREITDIRIGRQIGRGANGKILEAKWEGIEVVVKEFTLLNEASKSEVQTFEWNLLQSCEHSSRLRHPNIIRFLGIYRSPGARVPKLVLERLHCSLNSLLEQTKTIPVEAKLSILHDVASSIRYLHSRTPPIIHRSLSSNNILLSKGMEAKIGDLDTARFIDLRRQAQITRSPDTVAFMPPEVLATNQNGKYKPGCEKELDVFSFGCVMLHTLSQQWPAPSELVVVDPEMKVQSEVERRKSYFNIIDRSKFGMLIPLIKSCLNYLPKNRASIMTICEHLESLIDREHVPSVASLLHKLERKDFEMNNKDIEIHALRSDMSRIQIAHPHLPLKQVYQSSTDFWKNLKLTWEKCADLPEKLFARSIAELDGKVYIIGQPGMGSGDVYTTPFMYDSNKDHWSTLPKLPCYRCSLVSVPNKKQLLAIGGHTLSNDIVDVTSKVFLWDEKYKKWLTPYPDMPTARCSSSCISYGSSVIVAGGLTNWNPLTMTRSVEVLNITESDSHWSMVEQLPHVTFEAVPLIVNDNVYMAIGIDGNFTSTCNVVTASIPQLLQSSNDNNSNSQVWNKLPDLPYYTTSINYYKNHIVFFTGEQPIEKLNKNKPGWRFVPLIHMYNPHTSTWDCIGDIQQGYCFGPSVHVKEGKILFIGGIAAHGEHCASDTDDIIPTCMMLTISPHLTLLDDYY